MALALLGALMAVWSAPTIAQDRGFPRAVIDLTGAAITIQTYPRTVAVIGSDPALAQVVPDRRVISPAADPAALDWNGVGLLVSLDLYAAAYPALLDSARAAGVPVFQTIPVTSLSGWRETVLRLGQATGREDRAAALVVRLDGRLAWIRALTRGETPARVLILTPEGYTFGQNTLINDLIAAAGGINVAAEYADFRQIDDAAIRALAPDVILLAPTWESAAAFAATPAYADLPAVRRGRVFRLPFSPTQPADPAAAALILAIWLHVEPFS
jgi:ABC-type Fe3+-hydroxamate transport system substrate-binding protein